MNSKIVGIFGKSALGTALSAGVNLVSTMFIVRAFGSDIYADQVVDLSKIALIMVFAELIPSSFIVFKVQDERSWLNILIGQLLISAIIAMAVIFVMIQAGGVFSTQSMFLMFYAVLILAKKYMDVVLQSLGTVHKLFMLDLLAAGLRLVLLAAFFVDDTDPKFAVWASLTLSMAAAQGIGLYSLRTQGGSLSQALRGRWWPQLLGEAPVFVTYYPSIILKGLADSIVPITAERIFVKKDDLAVFLLVFRSLNFVLVFGRIYEAILNHRESLVYLKENGTTFLRIIAGLSYLSALIMSAVMVEVSGLKLPSFTFLLLLAAVAWPAIYSAKDRAIRLSDYKSGRVASSYLAYSLVFLTAVPLTNLVWEGSLDSFALCVLLASVSRYIVIRTW